MLPPTPMSFTLLHCAVWYIKFSSIIVQRLTPILHHIIILEQSSFDEGCQILDGNVSAHEFIHFLKSNKQPSILVKLDISKAYDRLSWKFLCHMLRVFVFIEDWICCIKSMIYTPFFSFIFNGAPTATFRSSRGLRQRYPISPFLFIIAANGLGQLLHEVASSNHIKGLWIPGMKILMTHQ